LTQKIYKFYLNNILNMDMTPHDNELWMFINVTIDAHGKCLSGWTPMKVNDHLYTWKRIKDNRTLSQIINDPSNECSYVESLRKIRNGSL